MLKNFAPKLVPTLLTVVMLATNIGLGVWQLQRAEWKGKLIAEWQAQAENPPIDELPPASQADTVKFAKARLIGKYLHDKQVIIIPRAYQGKTGYELITPLQMMTGEVVLVDRGFVADDSKEAIDQPIGTVFVNGELRPYPGRGWMQPANNVEINQWFWIDPAAIASERELDVPYPLLLVSEGKALNNMWPVPHPVEAPYTNNHLTYAFIWFSLAAALVVIYVLSQKKKD
jgi:surfeit locus 1 family protein